MHFFVLNLYTLYSTLNILHSTPTLHTTYLPLIVRRKVFDDIFMNAFVSPLAELHPTLTLHLITNGDDDIKVILSKLTSLIFAFYCAMLSGVCKICTYHISIQFTFCKYITDVPSNSSSISIKQLCYLILRNPHSFSIKPDIELRCSVLGLINYYFAFVFNSLFLFSVQR